ncbi:MAG: hypothetical protein MH204_02005 [Fimbriimonadaceae bacterium]|nr:hypothetical protein [Fimbriimonadaceae bacterium]
MHRWTWLIGLGCFCLMASMGCGGSGAGSVPGPIGASVTVGLELAPGTDLKNVVVVSGQSETAAGSGSGLKVAVNEEAPTLATVLDESSGKLMALAVLRPGAAGQKIDARSTAVALVHLAMGMSNEQTARRTALLDQLEAAPAIQTLADRIAAAWAADRFALESPPADLKTAIATAANAMATTVRSPSRSAAEPSPEARPASREVGEEFTVEPLPGAFDGDVSVRQVQNTLSPTTRYAFYNHVTRPATVYTYVLERGLDGFYPTPLSAPEPKEGPLSVPFLPQFGGILDYARTKDVPVSMADRVTSEIHGGVVLSGVFGSPDPAALDLPEWRLHAAAFRAELRRLRQLALVRIFADITLDLTGAGGQPYTQAQLESTLADLRASGTEMSLALDYATEPTGGIATLGQMLGSLAGSDDTTRRVLAALRPVAGVNARYLEPGSLSGRRVAALRAALRVFDVTGLLGPLAEYGTTLRDVQSGNPFQVVRYLIRRSAVRLVPNTGKYVPAQRLTIRLEHPYKDAGFEARFRFKITDGIETTLETIAGDQSGTEIETDKDSVFLRTTSRTLGYIRISGSVSYLDQGARKEETATAEFAQTGTLDKMTMTYVVNETLVNLHGFAVHRKEKLGRNRWEGGRFEITRWRNGAFERRHTVTIPEFVGRPFGWGTDFTRGARVLNDPEYGSLVVGYDLGDVLVIPIHTAFWNPLDPNFNDSVLTTARNAVTEGLASTVTTLVKRPD